MEHADVLACQDRCIAACLTYGLDALKNGQLTAALTLLKKVETNTHVKMGTLLSSRRRGELRAEGFAALASYYKVRGKNKEAIAYADKAFQSEQKHSPNQARMRLLLATLLSVAGKQNSQVVQ